MTASAMARALVLAVLPATTACHADRTRTPEDLRQAYAEAIRQDDPDRAYELLSPEAQAQVDRKTFRRRWKEQRKELEATLSGIENLEEGQRPPVWRGTTIHPSGRVLHWTYADERYWVVAGLPPRVDRSTVAGTVQAFIAALRGIEHGELTEVLTEELAEQLRLRWSETADAVEAALAEAGALEVSPDEGRAVLRYGSNKRLVLVREDEHWRITALE